ncbi:hypothetical protein [Nigerium massiliense]|uniref:hypothetical protein n=1 Tax=Nigerium massiliense TaxID=1522317 RepID=UPI0015687DEB|nr:hypothetical protein [Nigerium massiliense]
MTYVPDPCTRRTTKRASKSAIAPRISERGASNRTISSCSLGMRVPAGSPRTSSANLVARSLASDFDTP